jgi:hypothetical protein
MTTAILVIHLSPFYLKRDISETVFCLRLQVRPNEMSPVENVSLYLWKERKLALLLGPSD